MRHRWMVMLVVIVTTLATAQEVLKQYGGLKAQAEEWATLRLWTGFLNAYATTDEPPQARLTVCSASEVKGEQSQPSGTLMPERAIKIESAEGQRPDAASHVARVEVSVPTDDHHDDSGEASESASEPVRDVALLTETGDREQEELGEHVDEPAEPVSPSDDEAEIDSTIHALREVRLVSRAVNRPEAEVAPLNGGENPDAAIRQQTRTASRTQAQKARAMKRALKVLQIQLERAARLELRTARREVRIEAPNKVNTALRAANSTSSIATVFPTASQTQITRQDLAGISGSGGCASE